MTGYTIMADAKRKQPERSPEQVMPEEALRRMRSFAGRKEKFVAAIKKSKDRDLSA
jgi:hypothetical protein